jgi:hypothetical protein
MRFDFDKHPYLLHRDFETRSAANLKRVGAWRYAADPSTEIICIGYAIDDSPIQIAVPGQPISEPFIEAARELWGHTRPIAGTLAERYFIENAVSKARL